MNRLADIFILAVPFLLSAAVSIVMIITVGIVWLDISPVFSIVFCAIASIGTLGSLLVTYLFAKAAIEEGNRWRL